MASMAMTTPWWLLTPIGADPPEGSFVSARLPSTYYPPRVASFLNAKRVRAEPCAADGADPHAPLR
jgi:hypothetical protein